jgi:hypothetical protein
MVGRLFDDGDLRKLQRMLVRLDMKADFVATDSGTILARRTQKSLASQGGWQIYTNSYYGVDYANPTSRSLRPNGNEPANGFANNPQIEAEIAAWYNAASLDEEKTIVRRLNRLAIDYVVYAPLGVGPEALCFAQECERHWASAAAPVLGRQQGCVICVGPAIQIRRRGHPADSSVTMCIAACGTEAGVGTFVLAHPKLT